MDAIRTFLSKTKADTVRIDIVGDAMIDEYYSVDAKRISPEFPIPILRANDEFPDVTRPGGATNVCSQFRHFNSNIRFFGLLDEYGADVLQESEINYLDSVMLPEYHHIPIKRRFYDKLFPLCRFDIETKNYGLDCGRLRELQKRLLKQFANRPDRAPVTLYSNYNKGVFSGFESSWANRPHDPNITIVDPNSERPIEVWRGCDIIKPNEHEAQAITGKDRWQDQAAIIKDRCKCTAVVITQGGSGVVGIVGNDLFEYHPSHDTIPESVIGAGDCFMAFLSMAIARGMEVPQAAEVAFHAAAIYVTRKYNKPIAPWDLHKAVDPIEAKIHSSADDLSEHLCHMHGSKVFTNGCFDILHSGHVSMLRFAKQQGDILIVGVDDDENVRAQKGETRPVNNLSDRMSLLACLDFVDFVVPFHGSPANVIEKLLPVDFLVKGQDWKADKLLGRELVGEVVLAPVIEGKSSTKIIERIKQ